MNVICPVCSKPVPPPTHVPGRRGGGRPRDYCSADCRRRALLAHRQKLRDERRTVRSTEPMTDITGMSDWLDRIVAQ